MRECRRDECVALRRRAAEVERAAALTAKRDGIAAQTETRWQKRLEAQRWEWDRRFKA